MKKDKLEPDLSNYDKNLTSQEIEALGASKAADLRERDKRLAKEKEEERKKEERNKRIRKWGILIAIVLFLLLLMARCSQLPLPEEIKEVLNIGVEDTVDVDNIEVGVPVEGYDGRYALLTLDINKTPVFENGLAKGNLLISNDLKNVYAQYVEIFISKDGVLPELDQKIYTSKLILVGQALAEDSLDVNLPAGQYECIAYFNAIQLIDEETGKSICLIKDKEGVLQEVIDRKVIIDEETQEPIEELITKPFEKELKSLTQIKTGKLGTPVTITINKTATK